MLITKDTIWQKFDLVPLNNNQIKEGMILKFSYRSPNGVHDPAPLVYVLEVEGDRVWGLNLDYRLALVNEIINNKEKDLLPYKKVVKAPDKHQQEVNKQAEKKTLSGLPKLNKLLPIKAVPSIGDKKQEQEQKPGTEQKVIVRNIPPILLEKFVLRTQPVDLLRNYLPSRMKGKLKLIYKPE